MEIHIHQVWDEAWDSGSVTNFQWWYMYQPMDKDLKDEWIKKLWYIYTVKYYLAVKKKEILPFVTA